MQRCTITEIKIKSHGKQLAFARRIANLAPGIGIQSPRRSDDYSELVTVMRGQHCH